MTSRLEDLLESGERVVYREPPGWTPGSFWPLALEGPVLAGLLALGYFGLDPGLDPFVLFLMGSVVVFCVLWGLSQALLIDDRSRESLITDRRVLHMRARQGREVVTEVPLANVAAVDIVESATIGLADRPFAPCVIIGRRGGQENRLHDLRRAQDFATALVRQTNLPRPGSMGRLEHLSFYCWLFGGANVAFLCAIPFLRFTLFHTDPQLHIQVSLVLIVALFVPAAWLGTHLAALVAMALMPLFASAEQAGAWLRMRPQGRLAKWMLWKHPAYAKLASLVYGRRLSAAGRGP